MGINVDHTFLNLRQIKDDNIFGFYKTCDCKSKARAAKQYQKYCSYHKNSEKKFLVIAKNLQRLDGFTFYIA